LLKTEKRAFLFVIVYVKGALARAGWVLGQAQYDLPARSADRIIKRVSAKFATRKNDEWYCVSNEFISELFWSVERTRKTKNLPLRFFHFFAPQFFSEKGKGKFCFAVARVATRAVARRVTTKSNAYDLSLHFHALGAWISVCFENRCEFGKINAPE
jgi:hypothetical protein